MSPLRQSIYLKTLFPLSDFYVPIYIDIRQYRPITLTTRQVRKRTMDDKTIIFDKRTQVERLRSCEDLFESLRQDHEIEFDDEGHFNESVEKFEGFLDTKFPRQMRKLDEERIGEIRKLLRKAPQMVGMQKVHRLLISVTDALRSVNDHLSIVKEGYDALEENTKHALWLFEWLEARDKLFRSTGDAEKAIHNFNHKVCDLTTTQTTTNIGMVVTIQAHTVWALLQYCDIELNRLFMSYKFDVVTDRKYFRFVVDLQTSLEKEHPTSDKSLSPAASSLREVIIAKLRSIIGCIDLFKEKIKNNNELQKLLHKSPWSDVAARNSFVGRTDGEIKRYVWEVRKHTYELIPLIQRKRPGK